MARTVTRVIAIILVCLGCGAAAARTTLNVDVDLRDSSARPRITRFRRTRHYGWHSGTHYGPYHDALGRWHVGWHSGSHCDWYTLDVPVLSRVDKPGWEVYVRLGKGKELRVRGDLNYNVKTTTAVAAPTGEILRWLGPDGRVIVHGPVSHKRYVGNGWEGLDLGNSIIMMDLPGSPGVEIYLKQKTKDLATGKKPEHAAAPNDEAAKDRMREQRDKLLDQADQRFARGLYPNAALLYQKAMKLDETDAIARFAVAHSLFALGVYSTAGKNVRLALDNFPDWGQVGLDLPKFYKDKKTFFNKLVELKIYVGQHPGDKDARLLLAYCLYFSKDRTGALAQFEMLAKTPGGDKHAELFLDFSKYELYTPAAKPGK
ncbi:MAG: hypothetical protein ABIF82_02125 [Planctomycetota bacterium]